MRLRYLSKTEFQSKELATSESLLDFVLKEVRIYRVNVGHGGCEKVPQTTMSFISQKSSKCISHGSKLV